MRICSVLFSAVALATAALGAGCVASPGATAPEESGVAIPLVKQSNGNQYRLTAHFEITEPDGMVVPVDATADVPSVTVRVPPGINVIDLLDGWTLARSTDGGMTFSPVDAVLATFNPINLVVEPNRVATLSFNFIVRDPGGQVELTFGAFESTRQLTARVGITGAGSGFTAYVGTTIQFTIFFVAVPQSTVAADGTQALRYSTPTTSLELASDSIGLLTPVQKDFTGAVLDITARAHPDGTQDFSGRDMGFTGPFPRLTFGTGTAVLDLDANGAPTDTGYFAFGMPFDLSSNNGPLVSGTVQLLDVSVP